MVLMNKAVLSSFGFRAPTALLLFQCFISVFLVRLTAAAGLIRVEPFNMKIARAWLPVNLIFVGEFSPLHDCALNCHCGLSYLELEILTVAAGMICTSFFALKDLGVPMATVLKNVTNLFTILGDWWLYGRVYGVGVWLALALMALSAFCGAVTDLAFSSSGYAWQMVNCLFTAAYSLYLRGVMDKVSFHVWAFVGCAIRNLGPFWV